MDYDPIKDQIGSLVRTRPWLRRVFYQGLDLLFLRTWYVHRAIGRIFERLQAERPGEPVRVLDAGSGFGQYSYFIAKHYPDARITGVDVKEDYLADSKAFFAAEKLSDRVQFYQADLTVPGKPPFAEPAAFDFILSVDVMEHIEEDRAVFRNFAHALRPGGYVLINTPSDLGGSGITNLGQEGFIGEHVRDGYNLADLEAKLDEAHLEPVVSEYTYGPYGSAAWRMLIKWPMQMLDVTRAAAVLLPFYYLPALPLGTLLNALDLRKPNASGTGLLVMARRRNPAPGEQQKDRR